MNKFISRIRAIDAQIKVIDHHLDICEHIAAGLSLELCVGPVKDETEVLSLQLSSGTTELLVLLKKSLAESRHMNLTLLKSEYSEVTKFLGK